MALVAVVASSAAAAGLSAPGCEDLRGFVAPSESLFTPARRLAPPGPDRSRRAIREVERAIPLTRAVLFHPELDPSLAELVERLPLRLSSLVRGASYWNDPEIPWSEGPGGRKTLEFSGVRGGERFVYRRARRFAPPRAAGRYAGFFALEPSGRDGDRVVAELDGRFRTDAFGLARFVDLLSELPRHVVGDPALPADSRAGVWNGHDDAALARFRRDLPDLAAALERIVRIDHVLDVDDGERGREVLFDLDVRVLESGLEGFPHLVRYYRDVLARTTARSVVTDSAGRPWMRSAWEEGRIRLTLRLSDGAPVPLEGSGEPLRIDEIGSGAFRSVTNVLVETPLVRIGLEGIVFENRYERRGENVFLEARMTERPRVVGSTISRGILRYAADDLLETLIQGNEGRGLETRVSSEILPNGDATLEARFRAEVVRARLLELLARVVDLLSTAHSIDVRKDERRLFGDLHAAMIADFRRAVPALLELDRDPAEACSPTP